MTKYLSMGHEDPIITLCRMVIGTKYEDLPRGVVNYAKQCILDTIAVTIGGSAMEGIAAIVDFVKNKGGKPESIIPFYGGKVPASEAGLAIGRCLERWIWGRFMKKPIIVVNILFQRCWRRQD